MTLISVITPNYNYGKYLKDALDSILTTNVTNDYEIIVVDDGSTDTSHAVLKSYAYESRVKIFYLERNQGVASAVNYAIQQARGEFLHFFASDDLHQPGTLDLMAGMIRESPHISLFTADYSAFEGPYDAHHQKFLPCRSFTYWTPTQVRSLFRHTDFWLPGHTLFIRKTACSNYDPQLGPVCDWLNNHVLALEQGVGYLPRSLVKVRLHPLAYSAHMPCTAKRKMWLYLLDTLSRNPHRYDALVKSGILRMLGLKAIYLDLLKTPAYWKYLFPMVKREFEKQCFQWLGINRENFWFRRL